jgi:beta-glucanase (GH16 family)
MNSIVPGLPDSTKWGYDLGSGCPNLCGWGNNELQFYNARRAENARVENGRLLIEAHRESWQGMGYTSARLVSKHKGDWTYGRFEARIKCPVAEAVPGRRFGCCPLTGSTVAGRIAARSTSWSTLVLNRDSVFATAHTAAFTNSKGTENTRAFFLPDAESAFHVYAVEWRPEQMDFYVDDVRFNTVLNQNLHKTSSEWPFDQRFHLILNLAVGGNWGGAKGCG